MQTPLLHQPSESQVRARHHVDAVAPVVFVVFLLALVGTGFYSSLQTLLSILGFVGAFIAGLVGIGGAIVMIPMLLSIPPMLSLPALDVHVVAAIVIVQVTAAALTAVLVHRRFGAVSLRLVGTLGLGMVLASLAGGITSRWISSVALEGVFASMAAGAAVLLLTLDRPQLDARAAITPSLFDTRLAIALGAGTGFLAGLVGAGGGFMLVPLMVYALKVPLRVAVGTSLAIVACAAAAGALGKMVTGQVDWLLALALVVGALPGARLGSQVSTQVSTTVLARILGAIVLAVAVKMWWEILS